MSEQFIELGKRVEKLGDSKYRYETWPPDAWLEAGVRGTVVEYHKESPEVLLGGETFPALEAYAVVQWDLGENAQTAIEKSDEGITWRRVLRFEVAT